MGKAKQADSSGDEMQDENQAQTVVKKKGIKKVVARSEHTQPSTSRSSIKKSKPQSLFSKIAKKVNLHKEGMTLEQKQKIFDKVVAEASKKKVPKKDRKKQRYLIKKVLNDLMQTLKKEINYRLFR